MNSVREHFLQRWKVFSIPVAIWIGLIIPMFLIVAGLVWFIQNGIIWQDILTFFLFYQISMFGISIGAHRYLSHLSFSAPVWFECVLFIMASSALQYSPLFWSGKHRKHHKFTDKVGDPHSPWAREKAFNSRIEAWLHAHFAWAFNYDFEGTMNQFVPDLLKKPHFIFLHKNHYRIGMSIFFFAGIFEWWLVGEPYGFVRGIFWGSLMRLFVLNNSVFLINSLAGHGFGTRTYNLPDKSTNNALIFPVVYGDCWHHNHHANSSSASFQARWYQLDPYYYILKACEKMGMISNVKPFKDEHLEKL